MPYYKFQNGDVLVNRIKTHPKCEFIIHNNKVIYNNRVAIAGANVTNVGHVSPGYLNLYEINVDRDSDNIVYPFVRKEGNLATFSTVTTSQFANDFKYGDIISGSYPLSATITRERFTTSVTGTDRAHVYNLRNTLDYYEIMSPHYAFSSSRVPGCNKDTQELNLISIPSIFYGSSIKKGTVECKFYVSGTLIGHLRDQKQNGELIQIGPTGSGGSGSVAGVVLYNEGFLILTGAWNLADDSYEGFGGEAYLGGGDTSDPSWIFFGVGANDGAIEDGKVVSSSYNIAFQGTNYIPTLTMLAHAYKGELNYSNNPTFLEKDQALVAATGTMGYSEPTNMRIKNTTTSSYADPTGSFEKTTYISKIGLFDEEKNLIGIATLATPVKKTEERELTFKLKLDY
jgi:hypothetical protein